MGHTVEGSTERHRAGRVPPPWSLHVSNQISACYLIRETLPGASEVVRLPWKGKGVSWHC